MPKFEFDPKISLGNIVTIAVVLVGAAGAWFTVVLQQGHLSEKVAMIETTITTKTAGRDQQMSAHEARIRAVEIAQASQSSDLRSIQIGISRIEATLEKLQPRP